MVAGAGKISNMYRPVLMVTFAADHFLWNNSPTGYHLTSIFLHAINALLIYFLIYILFRNRFLAFTTSVFFVVHPVQSEAIIYASGRTDPLYTVFALLTMIVFLYLCLSKTNLYLKWIGVIIFFVLSLLSKESAIVIPLILILLYFVLKDKKTFSLFKLIIIISPLILISGIYIYLRLTVLNFANTLNFYPVNNIYSQNIFVRLLTFHRVLLEYLALISFPKDLTVARDIPYITSLNNFSVIISIAILIGTFWFSIRNWRKNRIYLFCLLWFLIAILPVSGIVPINNIMSEHYLYLPSLSFFLLIANFFCFLFQKFTNKYSRIIVFASVILILSALSLRTIIRTFDWRDPIIFYTKSLNQSPWHIPMRNNLAMAYAETGKIDLAIYEYKKIIDITDIYPNTHHNLANAYKTLGKYKEAEDEYYKALKIDPNFYFSYFGLADLYQKTGEKEKFERIVKKIK